MPCNRHEKYERYGFAKDELLEHKSEKEFKKDQEEEN